jgi:nickel/cobalt transporter (NicO) family protein
MRQRPAVFVWIVTLVLSALCLCPAATADPFTGRSSDAPAPASVQAERALGPMAMAGRALLAFNREANRLISQHMRAIRDGDAVWPLLVGIALAFTYGVVHALGPGHGKFVVVSYFLSQEAQIGRGLLMGLQIAVCHVISAIVVVGLADFVLRRALGGAPAEVPGVRSASYGLIALIGSIMLVQAIRHARQRRVGIAVENGCCGHAHGSHEGHAAAQRTQQGLLSFGVGLVPCTGAVLILLYALANDILFAGMLLVIAIAAGMAITMGGLGVLSVLARQMVVVRMARADGARARIATTADFAGPLAITTIGILLLWASL